MGDAGWDSALVKEVGDRADVLVNSRVVEAHEIGKGIDGVRITARCLLVVVACVDCPTNVPWQVV